MEKEQEMSFEVMLVKRSKTTRLLTLQDNGVPIYPL
jgi:hypothetical protein